MWRSSSGEKGPLRRLGRRWLAHRRRQLLPQRSSPVSRRTVFQLPSPWRRTWSTSSLSSACVHGPFLSPPPPVPPPPPPSTPTLPPPPLLAIVVAPSASLVVAFSISSPLSPGNRAESERARRRSTRRSVQFLRRMSRRPGRIGGSPTRCPVPRPERSAQPCNATTQPRAPAGCCVAGKNERARRVVVGGATAFRRWAGGGEGGGEDED
jgi:hypothetical protein